MTKTFNLKDVRFCNGNITKTAEWYDTLSVSIQNKIDQVVLIIREHRSVDERCSELQRVGIEVKKTPMGCGGVGKVKIMKNDEIRIQVGYGLGRYNYAKTAIL